MRFFKTYQRIALLLIIAMGAAITYTAYLAIRDVVAEQSRLQQQSVSPVFSLVYEEVLKPLQIARTLGEAKFFTELLDSEDIDESVMFSQLQTLEQTFGLIFFAASEKARTQYFSDGNTLELVEGKVYWYFEALAENKELIADLGNVDNVHLYYDVKVRNPQGEFLGFIGAGKSLKDFIATFDDYKARYGYDFLFVNEDNEIILSSKPELVVTDANIPLLSDLPWYDAYLNADDASNILVQDNGQDYLISEIRVRELDWKMVLLIPLQARQAQITRSFVTNSVLAVSLIVLLFLLAFVFMALYRRHLEKSIEIDALSRLPNRTHILRQYHRLRRQSADVDVVMVDIDRFKAINDTYGHNAGDAVIKSVANVLAAQIRHKDLVGRWGGEEFILLIPNESRAVVDGIAERARSQLENLEVNYEGQTIGVTASFGIVSGPSRLPLSKLLSKADSALYKAKKQGRNRVIRYTE